jgi:hypothetical protein
MPTGRGFDQSSTVVAHKVLAGRSTRRSSTMSPAVLVRAASVGQLTAQARKTYVSLLTPRRTFAAVQATTRHRVDLGLKFATPKHGGRLLSAVSMGSSMVNTRVELSSVEDVDDDVQAWLRRAYQENA